LKCCARLTLRRRRPAADDGSDEKNELTSREAAEAALDEGVYTALKHVRNVENRLRAALYVLDGVEDEEIAELRKTLLAADVAASQLESSLSDAETKASQIAERD
jgi:hypothetical protein